ncbi:replication-relaxation family protein [Paenibacillus aestuarii]|uniref:Replication-relaxation family protein n=1 Tax=Paenibacillus aestuarii TaxID=516965 RepID=A0ABW0K789_9BACL
MKILRHSLSDEQIDILKWIHLYRGITTRQLLAAKRPLEFPPHLLDPKVSEPKEKSIRKLIGLLVKKGLVAEKVVPKGRANYAYLTEEGLELISIILEISPGKIGTGYSGDHGDFDYELYSPPSTKISHHLILVNFFLMLEHLKAKYYELKIDYRDNRYVSERYVLPDLDKSSKHGTKKIMPDGEIRLNDQFYPVEIDMGTERYKELVEKFEKYAEYFDFLQEHGRPLPEGIIFISGVADLASQFRRRWDTVIAAFFQGMDRWAAHVNLIGGTLNCVERIITEKSRDFTTFGQMLMNILGYYTKTDGNYKGTAYRVEIPIPKLFTATLSITQIGANHQVYVYEPVSGFETKGLARVRSFKSWLSKTKIPEFQAVSEVIPVFYHLNGQPMTFNFKKFDEKAQAEWEGLFSLTYWLNVEGPVWTDIDGESVAFSNPLLSRVSS